MPADISITATPSEDPIYCQTMAIQVELQNLGDLKADVGIDLGAEYLGTGPHALASQPQLGVEMFYPISGHGALAGTVYSPALDAVGQWRIRVKADFADDVDQTNNAVEFVVDVTEPAGDPIQEQKDALVGLWRMDVTYWDGTTTYADLAIVLDDNNDLKILKSNWSANATVSIDRHWNVTFVTGAETFVTSLAAPPGPYSGTVFGIKDGTLSLRSLTN